MTDWFIAAITCATNSRSYPNCDTAEGMAGRITDATQRSLALNVVRVVRDWIDQSYKLEGRDPNQVKFEMEIASGKEPMPPSPPPGPGSHCPSCDKRTTEFFNGECARCFAFRKFDYAIRKRK